MANVSAVTRNLDHCEFNAPYLFSRWENICFSFILDSLEDEGEHVASVIT